MNAPHSRRRFFGRTSCAAMSSLPALNTLLNLKMAGNLAAASAPPTSEYRALVCLFFSGGMDTFNVLVPHGDQEYADYAATRGGTTKGLALAKETLLKLTPATSGGPDLALHPKLPGLRTLFDSGKAAFIANVGTLLEHVTLDQDQNLTGPAPLGLFSHSDQIEQWQTGTSNIRSARGWGGRAADLLHSLNGKQQISMNISLSGGNVWQSGEDIFAYTVDTGGATRLAGYDPSATGPNDTTAVRTRAIDRQLALSYQHLLTEEFASRKRAAIETYQLFNDATSKVDIPSTANFNADRNYLGAQLQMVAQAIGAASALGHKRQTFYVEIGGWDMHSKLIQGMNDSLPDVNEAITAFYNFLAAKGLENNVTTYSASDFARTLSSNGDGADHAWGGNHFVFGGAVNGATIYGTYPSLVAGPSSGVDDRGRFVPTTAVDVYFAELALWLGVSRGDLATVLPNIGTFYDPTKPASPMGFLA